MVMIHPKDSGPIDTSDRGKCNHCDRTVRLKGQTVYKDKSVTRRRRDRKHSSVDRGPNVCPYCNHHINGRTNTIKCTDCNTIHSVYDIPQYGEKQGCCPSCDVKLKKGGTAEMID